VRVALVNPPWTFDGSVYFGCREAHLPLEYGYARALLAREGHEVRIFDGQLQTMSLRAIRASLFDFRPEMTVVTTAPSYLFWRCAPPELRVPIEAVDAVRDAGGMIAVVGPHTSTTPRIALRKLAADVAVIGECEETLVTLARTPRDAWRDVPSIAYREGADVRVQGGPHACDLASLPPLAWEDDLLARHRHHHHRFDAPPRGPAAEIESSRGCPYHCTFCAKDNFRNRYRKRRLETVLAELDALIAQGVTYVYFIDEIFLPDRPLLEALAARDVVFGVQMRIDQWSKEMLDLLGRAGCVSIEAGVESITPEGRSLLAKRCKLTTADLTELLLYAKRCVPFVQANLLEAKTDDPGEVRAWRETLHRGGVWANEPVPLFPYPGSPEYTRQWGEPDDDAWERAHAHYLAQFGRFSDIQESRPRALRELEAGAHG
jgi:B12-binding domain/radical SAM domain protein of rhizo-twelve system